MTIDFVPLIKILEQIPYKYAAPAMVELKKIIDTVNLGEQDKIEESEGSK